MEWSWLAETNRSCGAALMAFGSRVRAWVGAREAGTLAALLLAAGGVWLFLEIADEVLEGATASVDEQVLLMLRAPADSSDPLGPPWVEDLARDITGLGGAAILPLLTAASAVFLALQRMRHLALYLLAAVASGTLVEHAAEVRLRSAAARPRPSRPDRLHEQLSKWPFDAVGRRVLDARRIARERPDELPFARLSHQRRGIPHRSRRHEPRLLGRALAHGRPRRLDGRCSVGALLLGARREIAPPRRRRMRRRRARSRIRSRPANVPARRDFHPSQSCRSARGLLLTAQHVGRARAHRSPGRHERRQSRRADQQQCGARETHAIERRNAE